MYRCIWVNDFLLPFLLKLWKDVMDLSDGKDAKITWKSNPPKDMKVSACDEHGISTMTTIQYEYGNNFLRKMKVFDIEKFEPFQ